MPTGWGRPLTFGCICLIGCATSQSQIGLTPEADGGGDGSVVGQADQAAPFDDSGDSQLPSLDATSDTPPTSDTGDAETLASDAGDAEALASDAGDAEALTSDARDAEALASDAGNDVHDGAESDSSASDAAPADAAPAPPIWCVDGAACTPGNQCHVGAVTCAPLGCSDTGSPVPDGTACSSGSCQGGHCTGACIVGDQSPGRLDCLFDPCMLGFCTTNPPGQLGMVGSIGFCNDIAVSSSSPLPAPHGMQCGSNPRQVCQAGACTVVPCTSNTDCGQGERCDAPAIPCTSTMVIAVGSCQGPYYSFKCVPGP